MPAKNKQKYQKPTIVPHVSGLMNKIGKSSMIRFMDTLEGVPLKKLMEDYGSPLFVFSEKGIRDTYRRCLQAFQLRYPKVQMAWSYKTNYLKGICSIFHSEGSIAEVVSEFEYEKARRLGIPGNKIIFNGPYKTRNALKRALTEGSMLFVDNFDELQAIHKIAKEDHKKYKIGLRLNLDAGIYPHWTRFGFNLETGQALEAIKRIKSSDLVEIDSLHCHIGTFILDPKAYGVQVQKMMNFSLFLKKEFGIKISKLDLGGGFASKNTLHSQYISGESASPSFEEYAEAITQKLAQYQLPPEEMPTIFIESGRALVDESGFLLTSVVATRRLPDGSRSLVLDAGVNLMYTATWYKHDIIPMEDYGDFMENSCVFGPLCMNIDVVRPHILLPVLKPGNKLVIKNVGAYCVTQWMQFIQMRPAVVMVDSSSKVHLLREAETIDTLEDLERLPEHLAKI